MTSGYRLTKLSPAHSRSIWDVEESDFPSITDELDLTTVLERCESSFVIRSSKSAQKEAKHLVQAFVEYSAHVAEMVERRWQVTLIEKLLSELRARVARLEEHQTIIVPVETFDPEPYDLVRPFSVVAEPVDGEFIATFYDANLSASGDTTTEAVSNLKNVILSTFELLTTEKKLGVAMARQKAVLGSIIRPR